MCPHHPPCPPVEHPARDTARIVACHPPLGWSVLCNGAIVFHEAVAVRPEQHTPLAAAPLHIAERHTGPRRPVERHHLMAA